MSELRLTSHDIRRMYSHDLSVYAGSDGLYLAGAPHWPDDRLVADPQDVADILGYTHLESIADEDEVVVTDPADVSSALRPSGSRGRRLRQVVVTDPADVSPAPPPDPAP